MLGRCLGKVVRLQTFHHRSPQSESLSAILYVRGVRASSTMWEMGITERTFCGIHQSKLQVTQQQSLHVCIAEDVILLSH